MTSSPPQPQPKTKFTLTGAQETLIVTLYSKHHDSLLPTPILGDKWASYVLDQLDYDFPKLGIDPNQTGPLVLHSRAFDRWTAEFLDAYADSGATVVHLACGLDTRALWLKEYLSRPGGRVRWVDVDMPDVVELRRMLLPSPEGDYRLVGASVNEEEWLWQIPADRPTVVVFEGLSMYLTPE
ncbi:S-adenosyl-L-methionine-dependent methyltransferase [Cadophora sp. DSE1049]|nr:S-adenosyl-L-methionine-dependent methyltransferase [Cadophora sp. DSE1049]